MWKKKKPAAIAGGPPNPHIARSYVHEGIHGVGGLKEAYGGLIHKTLPAIFSDLKSTTVASVLALFFRVLIVAAAAIFPLVTRKFVFAGNSDLKSPEPKSTIDAFGVLLEAIASPTPIDIALGLITLFLIGAPKVIDLFALRSSEQNHAPFVVLADAIKNMPIKAGITSAETVDAIRMTLLALRQEMSLLIGDGIHQNVTDVTLLEYCDAGGKKMMVRARTANHEGTSRPIESSKLVAHYVAMEGRNFSEHDFTNRHNPFPPVRVSVIGEPRVGYRSVLFMPIVCSERLQAISEDETLDQIVDSCVGVICVHSAKAYRFWRWGDHKKGTGGFADVAFGRSTPYIALVEQLLSRTAVKVRLEVK